MKHLILPLLLALLLCGCGGGAIHETTFPDETTMLPEPTEPAGIYCPESAAEMLTEGAVRMYLPSISDIHDMAIQGGDILLFSGQEGTTLTKLTGENLFTIAETRLPCGISPKDPSFQFSGKGITYYDEQARAVVFLDEDLKEVNRLAVPEMLTGKPALASDRLKLYYCTEDAVRVLDLETGLDRLLKQISYPEQSVSGIWLDDTVLQCTITDSDAYTIFLSTQTGSLLCEPREDLEFTAGSGMYYAGMFSGDMRELVYGRPGEEPRMLIPEDAFADSWYLAEINGLVTASCGDTAVELSCYDLDSGLRTGAVTLPGETAIWCAEAEPESGLVYLMGYDIGLGREVIYRWDVSRTPSGDTDVYSGPRYTLEEPDTAGLTACESYAGELGSRYGVQILVGLEAARTQPWDYELETEYQVPVLRRELEKMSRLLENFPEGFFEDLDNTKICLVRSLSGSAESGSLERANGIQFWVGDTAYVALAAGEVFEQTFYHELFHVIETHVFSECTAYYDWDALNPQGFEYDMSYIANPEREDSEYLRDETRAFIDSYSMSYPKEDRARIMEYAATAGHGYYFQSDTMQAKLETLCMGIREAFDLGQYPNALIWEQYLKEPLTP